MRFELVPSSLGNASLSTLALDADPDGYTTAAYSAAVDMKATTGSPDAGNSRVTVRYKLKRVPTFFIYRFVVPLVLGQLMLISTFAFTSSFAPRITTSLAAFGTTISFLFVSAQTVPPLPYQTRLDKFFLLCFFNAFTMWMVNLYKVVRWDRFAKVITEAHKRSGAKTLFGAPRKVVQAPAAAPVCAPAAAPAGAAAAPPADVKKDEAKKDEAKVDVYQPTDFFGVLSEMTVDNAPQDFLLLVVFTSVFSLLTCLILYGPAF